MYIFLGALILRGGAYEQDVWQHKYIQRTNTENGIDSKAGEETSSYTVKLHIFHNHTFRIFFIEDEGVDDQSKYFYSLSSMTNLH